MITPYHNPGIEGFVSNGHLERILEFSRNYLLARGLPPKDQGDMTNMTEQQLADLQGAERVLRVGTTI